MKVRSIHPLALAVGVILLAFFFLFVRRIGEPTQLPNVRLVLVLVADQFPQEYIERFGPLFRGGLKTLVTRGARFTRAHHEHANTSTCPGHAALVSGTHPRRSGIVGNSWFDRKSGRSTYCVQDKLYGRSPRLLLRSTLADWFKKNRHSRVYSASAKDRAAVIGGGRSADGAFWYDKRTGEFTTSTYYLSGQLRRWLQAYNKELFPVRFFGKGWSPLPISEEDLTRSQVVELDEGVFPSQLPYVPGAMEIVPGPSFFGDFYRTPFMDEYLADFAKQLIVAQELGKDRAPDLFLLSFSALDSIGHDYGPNSRQVLDALLRLDQTLKNLFEFLESQVGMENVLVAFTSDHGVLPFPEYLQMDEENQGRRLSSADFLCAQSVHEKLKHKFGTSQIMKSNLYIDHAQLKKHDISRGLLDEVIVKELERCNSIKKVWTRSDLQRSPETGDAFQLRYYRGFHPDRSGDYFLQLEPYHLNRNRRGTNHGSPYGYDSHVPMIFMHPGLVTQSIKMSVATVDFAPTIATLSGVLAARDLDGVDLSPLLKRAVEVSP